MSSMVGCVIVRARRIELVYRHTDIGNLIVKQQVLGVSSGSQR